MRVCDSRNVQLQECIPVPGGPCATHHPQDCLGRNKSSFPLAGNIGLFVCSSAWALAERFHGVLGKTFALEYVPWIFLCVLGFCVYDSCGCPQAARPHNGRRLEHHHRADSDYRWTYPDDARSYR